MNREDLALVRDSAACIRMSRPVRRLQGGDVLLVRR